MINLPRWMTLATLLTLAGCVSASVQKGAVIGAASGAIAGAGLGALVSDKDLLGNTASKQNGDLALDAASSISAGVVIGAVFGGIVGAMIGHSTADKDEATPGSASAQAAARQPRAF
jgi:uncharacterized protein YcfJ